MRSRTVVLRIGAIVLLFALAGALVSADPPDPRPERQLAEGVRLSAASPHLAPVQYMVKFVCGYVAYQPTGEEPPVKPGNYATAINIDNYTTDRQIITKRVHVHYREGQPVPPVFAHKSAVIYPWRVLEIDCTDIWALTGTNPGTFLKGMVHIGTGIKLPVAAVYTAQTNITNQAPDAGAGISIDVEQYDPFIEQIAG